MTLSRAADSVPCARQTIRRIGYTDPAIGFDADTCTVLLPASARTAVWVGLALGVLSEVVNAYLPTKQVMRIGVPHKAGRLAFHAFQHGFLQRQAIIAPLLDLGVEVKGPFTLPALEQ